MNIVDVAKAFADGSITGARTKGRTEWFTPADMDIDFLRWSDITAEWEVTTLPQSQWDDS